MSTRKKALLVFPTVLLVSVVALSLALLLIPLPAHKPYSLVVLDRHGNVLQAFLASDGMWRMKTSLHEVPEQFKQILLNKEDKYFYYHLGVNPVSLVRSFFQNLMHGRTISGASTITMQVARLLEPKERTYFNKVKEIFRALQLELRYSKAEILEMYLSLLPLGGNIEGLKTGALMYYQTPVGRLNVAQLIDLILVPNDPTGLRPDRKSPELYNRRISRAKVWLHSGVVDKRDSIVIWQTKEQAVRRPLPALAPHFSARVMEQSFGSSEVLSSLDLRVQRTCERLLKNHLQPWKLIGVQNGAVFVVENKSMEVAAYVGSENFYDSLANGQVDAIRARRSPGSTLKPFLYALQFDKGMLTPKSRLADVPYDAEGYVAENYDGTYSGFVFADEALRKSLNVPMIRLLKETGTQPFVDVLTQIGFSSLETQKNRLGLSMIVGGCGVTLEELVSAYTVFPHAGRYHSPYFVHQKDFDESKSHDIFSDASAFMVTEILSSIDRPDLPNNFESAVNLPGVAFKTGTSYGRKDAWCVGYSTEYTVGVWLGNVTGRGSPELVGARAATPLLIDIFNAISHTNQKNILPQPQDVKVREVCSSSGKIATSRCQATITEYYSVSRTQRVLCNVDKEYFVSEDGKLQYCTSCLASNNYRVRIFKEFPPEIMDFFRRSGVKAALAPPHNPECERVFSGDGPKITSPTKDMTYFVVSKDQRITFQASSTVDIRNHAWYLDDRFLGRKPVGEKLFMDLSEGNHTITCVDDKGRNSSVRIRVKRVL